MYIIYHLQCKHLNSNSESRPTRNWCVSADSAALWMMYYVYVHSTEKKWRIALLIAWNVGIENKEKEKWRKDSSAFANKKKNYWKFQPYAHFKCFWSISFMGVVVDVVLYRCLQKYTHGEKITKHSSPKTRQCRTKYLAPMLK